jgi:hypothetical protein
VPGVGEVSVDGSSSSCIGVGDVGGSGGKVKGEGACSLRDAIASMDADALRQLVLQGLG